MALPRFNNDGLAPLVAIFAIAVLGALGTAACGGGKDAPASPALQEGKVTFNRVCATCHGPDAKGLPGLGKSLLDNAYTQGLSDAELIDFLEEGRSATDDLNETGIDMPPRGGDPTLSDESLAELAAFLRTL